MSVNKVSSLSEIDLESRSSREPTSESAAFPDAAAIEETSYQGNDSPNGDSVRRLRSSGSSVTAASSSHVRVRRPDFASNPYVSEARILIIDRTPDASLLSTLRKAGHDVILTQNVGSGLSFVQGNSPDLVLLDTLPPRLDGVDICRRIKSRAQYRDLPVMFYAANGDSLEKRRAFEAGAIDFIQKPAPASEVLARITTRLQARALQRSLARELELRLAIEEQLRQSLDRAVVLIDDAGCILFSSRQADILLEEAFPDFVGGVLPAGLFSAESKLSVRRFPSSNRRHLTLYALERKDESRGPGALVSLGLTPREAEVLFWVAHGKSNGDISLLLGTSIRTIHKHVENIFRKLGCETRTAAGFLAGAALRNTAAECGPSAGG